MEVVTSPDKHSSCSSPPPERAGAGWKHSLFSPPRLGVGMEKLLFARVLLVQTSMSSPTRAHTAMTPMATGVRAWARSPEMVGMNKEHPILPAMTHRPRSADARMVDA